MFGHNSFDSPQPLVFGTVMVAPRKLYGDKPQFFEFCDDGSDGTKNHLTQSAWFKEGKEVKSFNGKKLGSYWLPKGWTLNWEDAEGNHIHTDIALEGKKVCVPSNRTVMSVKAQYVGFCEDSNRKSKRESLIGESVRDDKNVCGDCVDGYEENDDGKCVESQSENGETELQEGTNWPLLAGGITVLGLGAYFVLNK